MVVIYEILPRKHRTLLHNPHRYVDEHSIIWSFYEYLLGFTLRVKNVTVLGSYISKYRWQKRELAIYEQ